MTVRLISISRPVGDVAPDTASLLAFCARVSSTANQSNHETGRKLLASLVKRQEWSPFEMVSPTMEIVTTRDIARQILRHRSFSFQEFSQRYAAVDAPPVFREARLQHETDRQMSVETDNAELQDHWRWAQEEVAAVAFATYRGFVAKGIAKEVARSILPEGMTESRLFMAGTLRSWIHYIGIRADQKTQKEHRLIAEEIGRIIAGEFPELGSILGEAA